MEFLLRIRDHDAAIRDTTAECQPRMHFNAARTNPARTVFRMMRREQTKSFDVLVSPHVLKMGITGVLVVYFQVITFLSTGLFVYELTTITDMFVYE